MLLKLSSLLALASLAKAAPQPIPTASTASEGGSCTQVVAPGTTQPIVDNQGQTLACIGATYEPAPTTTVTRTNVVTATVNNTGVASVVTQTATTTYVPPEASADLAIASATEKLNAAMAKATLTTDRFLWRGALSIASDFSLSEAANVGDELSLRRRFSEVCEAQFYIERTWTATRIFGASGYEIDTQDPEEWAKIVSGDDTSNSRSWNVVRDGQDLFATVTLWPGTDPLLVNTTWKEESANETNVNQLWKSALISTVELPQVKQRLKEYNLTENITAGLPRDDQLLAIYGMTTGQPPVKRVFKENAVHGVAVALAAAPPFSSLVFVQSKSDAAHLRPSTTYVVTNLNLECKKEDGTTYTCEEKDRRVSLGMSVHEGQVEQNGFSAEVSVEELEGSIEYMIHQQTPAISMSNCGWTGKDAGEDRCIA